MFDAQGVERELAMVVEEEDHSEGAVARRIWFERDDIMLRDRRDLFDDDWPI